tara:strand:- start:5120 stop:5602 length:483 start_codon:yes stop_codon:yes gene_type:complete
MNVYLRNTALALLTTILFSNQTLAEIRMTAFAAAPAFNALKVGNAEWALRFFENRKLENMNFSAANNLCVAQVLKKQLTRANSSCEAALTKTAKSAYLTGARRRKEAEAIILSNLAMIGLLSGNLEAAREYAEQASARNTLDRETKALLDSSMSRPLAIK